MIDLIAKEDFIMDTRPSFDKTAIHSVELNLLDGQVDLILRSLEFNKENFQVG